MKKMNLLERIQELNINDLNTKECGEILNLLIYRLEKINDLEPDGCGYDYRMWAKKKDELEYLISDFEYISNGDELNEFKNNIQYYQEQYHGLKRLFYVM